MATIKRVIRVSNPRRVRSTSGRFVKRSSVRKVKRKSSSGKKAPVIRRYSVKMLKQELKRRGVKSNPSTRRKRGFRKTTRRKNPVLIELGMVNPKRRINVAKKKVNRRCRTSNPRRRVTRRAAKRTYRRRRNPIVTVTKNRKRRAVRRRNPAVRRRRRSMRRRNPSVFGQTGGKNLFMMVGGGLVGVAATKFLPTLIPQAIRTSIGTGAIMNVLVTGAGAFAASFLAKRFVGGPFADAVLFGGLMQAGSVALTALAPPELAARLALS